MTNSTSVPPRADHLKRVALLTILALSLLGSGAGWVLTESRGSSSPTLRVVFGLNIVFLPTMFVVVWRRLLPIRTVDLSCLVFAAGLCAACMALRFYSPTYGSTIDLQPLYLWIPAIYAFAFTLSNNRTSLAVSVGTWSLFVGISVPHLVSGADPANRNVTIQMHLVSAVLIATLYYFASHLHRFHAAQLTVHELARLANTDDLTKLANRRRTAEAIEFELLRYAHYGHEFSIVLLDIDRFKTVNDRYGHVVGDAVLVALAARASDVVRDVDVLGRWGGEEFVVVLPATPFAESLRRAGELCDRVAARPLVDDHAVTVSCGVATVAPGDTAETLLRRADEALYVAKRRGRNRAEGLHDRSPDRSPDTALVTS